MNDMGTSAANLIAEQARTGNDRPAAGGAPLYTHNADADQRLHGIFQEIGGRVADRLPTPPAAVLLTGSFARGEGSILRDKDRLQVLSDMEFMVVNSRGADINRAQQFLDEEAHNTGKYLARQGIECEVEFNSVHRDYLNRVHPAIFSYELMAHARTVWGDAKILTAAPRFPISAIPRWDAWRLLNNRLLEQLQWAEISARWEVRDLRAAFYHALKCYLDMATVILIFAGHYRSRYGERAAALETWARAATREDAPFAEDLAERVAACTTFKLRPGFGVRPLGVDLSAEPEMLSGEVRRAIAELIRMFHLVWRWAGNAFIGTTGRPVNDDLALQNAVMRTQPRREKLRGWAKLALMPEVRRRPDFFSRMGRLLLKGSPRYLVYTVASNLCFRLPEILNGMTPELTDQEELLPVTFVHEPVADSAWWRLRDDVLSGWRLFLRNHWA